MTQKLVQCQCSLDPDGQLIVGKVLIDSVKNMLEVFLSCRWVEAVWHAAELAVEPAWTGTHEGILACELIENILLEEGLHASLQLQRVRDLVLQVAQRVQDSLLHTEVLGRSLQVLGEHLEIVR